MNFGQALEALKDGKKVTRQIWDGYWYLAKDARLSSVLKESEGYTRTCHFDNIIVAVLKDNDGVDPAQPYQRDILAEDWEIVE